MGKDQQELIEELEGLHAQMGAVARRLLATVAELDRAETWREEGARDVAHFLSIRLGISTWKAYRWVQAARALEHLPRLSRALEAGDLSLDKVVELARFATPEDEARLIRWAQGVAPWAVRRRADLAARQEVRADREAHATRRLSWWFSEEDRRFQLLAELPAAEGAVVARAIGRAAATVPAMPGEEGPPSVDARRADALVALARASLAADPEPDRATVVVHVPLAALAEDRGGAEIEGGPVIHPETARRLVCQARVQVLVEDDWGNALWATRTRRFPPEWMMRLLRHRDRGCQFPGCGSRAFLVAHHIRPWSQGGKTTLENLVLLCSFHHRLVHEDGWGLWRARDGTLRWTRPGGRPYRPRPGPGLCRPLRAAEVARA